jgi:hypothetical protein
MRLYLPAPVFFGGKLIKRGYHDANAFTDTTAAYLVTRGHAVVVPDEDETAGDTEPITPLDETDEDKTPVPVKRRNTKRG